MSESKWKSKLLSSSTPLEYQAASVLVEQGFMVRGDYSYSRLDAGYEKEFSVDVHANAYTPFTNPDRITSSIDLLVECKFRHPGIEWLFLPDVNTQERTTLVSGQTLRGIDHFSFWYTRSTSDFDGDMYFCYRGAEVNLGSGEVHSSEIKHGIQQLTYALPSLLGKQIRAMLSWRNDEENVPFYLCPILLTTAPLRVVKESFSVETVSKATCLDDVSDLVPYLVHYSDTTSDFDQHRAKAMKSLGNWASRDVTKRLSDFKKRTGWYSWLMPDTLLQSFGSADLWGLDDMFENVVICTWSAFPELICNIRKVCSLGGRTRSKRMRRWKTPHASQ